MFIKKDYRRLNQNGDVIDALDWGSGPSNIEVCPSDAHGNAVYEGDVLVTLDYGVNFGVGELFLVCWLAPAARFILLSLLPEMDIKQALKNINQFRTDAGRYRYFGIEAIDIKRSYQVVGNYLQSHDSLQQKADEIKKQLKEAEAAKVKF